jgi:hypothetical protein
MASKRRDKVGIILRKEADGRLSPVAPIDAEQIDALKVGVELNATLRSKRSNPQLRLYWSILAEVVRATDKWPTPEHLSEALKQACGFLTKNYRLDGTPFIMTDSIAFDAMTQPMFQGYFDSAMAKLADAVGFDPLAAYEQGIAGRMRARGG